MTVDVQRFEGGRTWLTRAGVVGVASLAVTFAAMIKDPRPALFSYLIAFAFWAGIGFGALVLLMLFHAFHAKWMVVLRRPIESMAASVWIFLPLFVPLALGMEHVWSWVKPGPHLNAEEVHLLHHKAPYLNVPFFLVRTFIYLAAAAFVARRFYGWSTRQDDSGDAQLTVRQRHLAAGGLPLMAVVFSFAAFDWMMSLDPYWFSTIFGVYYFAGSFLATVSLVVIVTLLARGKDLYGDYVTPEHTHNLGKIMLAFTAFWAYIGFSQFMLIWIAGLPEEIPFYLVRMTGAWAPVGVFLIVGHFFLPFFALLSRELKRQPRRLALVAAWLMLVDFVDLYWLITPTLSPDGPSFHFTLVTAFLGVGGVAVAAVMWKVRGNFTIPVKDPFLAVSLRYRQP